jgi:hypothetical protein
MGCRAALDQVNPKGWQGGWQLSAAADLAVSDSFAILVGFSEISEGFHVFVIPGFLALRHVKDKDGFTAKAGLFWD